MEDEHTCFNQEYAPIADDFISAKTQDNQNDTKKIEKREVTRQKRISQYDNQMYSLPVVTNDDDSTPPKSGSVQPGIWKIIAIVSIIFGILGVSAVFAYFMLLNQKIKGSFVVVRAVCLLAKYNFRI